MPLSWLLVRITFFVRQLNSPRNLIVHSGSTSPPRTSNYAQSSFQTAFLILNYCSKPSQFARLGQPNIVQHPKRLVKWLQATGLLSPLQLNSCTEASFRCVQGTPILAALIAMARGRNPQNCKLQTANQQCPIRTEMLRDGLEPST